MPKLVEWKNSSDRKPLILNGVRQSGKTWLLEEFGSEHFEDVAYFNFDRQQELASFFETSLSPKDIIFQLGIFQGKAIFPDKTLVIFDEIQACPKAINALKYFCEQAPEYAIVSAGSLLGVSLAAADAGFPVGKVSFLELNPCSFKEYLRAADPMLCSYTESISSLAPIPEAFLGKLNGYLREYITLGGMPEVLTKFLEKRDIFEAAKTLDEIVKSYELDFSKHAPKVDIPKLFLIWNSIPAQLAKENAKFVFGEAKPGARAKDLEDAMLWLQSAGLVKKVNNTKTPMLPLASYEERKIFKLYLSDTGVLRQLAKLPVSIGNPSVDLFAEFKGRLLENYVLQQLVSFGTDPIYYWTGNNSEVDFVIQNGMDILPIEVKSGLNLKAKSLKLYREKYSPHIAVRTSMQNLKFDNGLLNIPLPLMGEFKRLTEMATAL